MGASTAEIGARIVERVGSADPVGAPATSLMSALAALTPARSGGSANNA
jgi:3-isopropylmalate dehydrogenase